MVSLGLLIPGKSVLTSWYICGLDNCSIYVLLLRLSRVAEQGPGIRVELGGG